MADRYFDLNGSTAGFGTLTGAWNTTSAFWSTSSAGTAVPGTFTFTSADRAFFGAAGATATAGTATIADGVTVTLNGITTANLAGLQTIARTTSGTLAFAGTTPSLVVGSAGGLTISAPVAFNAATTVNNSSTVTLSGQLTGSGTLTKSSSGNLVLTGTSNNNSGNVTINAGTIFVGGFNSGTPNQLGSVGTIALGTTGNIQFLGNTFYASSSNITGTGGSVGIAVRNTSPSGFTFNAGALSASTYTGGISLYADSNEGGATSQTVTFNDSGWTAANYLYANNASATNMTQTYKHAGSFAATTSQPLYLQNSSATQTVVLHASSSGDITWSGNASILGTPVGAMTLEFKNDSTGVTTFSGAITDGAYTLNVRKSGTGTATFSGANSFDGTVSVLAGKLNANSTTALGADTSSGTVSSGAMLSLGAALNYSTRTFTISGTGVFTGGALVHAFAGTAKIGAVTLGASAYIRGTATGTLSSSLALSTFTLTTGAASGTTLSLTGGISNGSLIVGIYSSDTGTVALPTSNSYAGTTTLAQYGTLSLGNASALGTSTLAFSGGSIDASTPLTITNAVTVSNDILFRGTAALTLSSAMALGATRLIANSGSAVLTLSGAITASAGGTITASGGPLVLTSASNSFPTKISIANQYLSFANGALGSSGIIEIGDSALRWETGNTQDVSARFSFTGGFVTLNTQANNVTLASSFGNSSASLLLTTGTGSLTLTAANTYTGGTQILAGTLRAGHTNALNTTGTVVLASTLGTLQTLTTGGQNGRLTVAALTNSAGGTIKIGG